MAVWTVAYYVEGGDPIGTVEAGTKQEAMVGAMNLALELGLDLRRSCVLPFSVTTRCDHSLGPESTLFLRRSPDVHRCLHCNMMLVGAPPRVVGRWGD